MIADVPPPQATAIQQDLVPALAAAFSAADLGDFCPLEILSATLRDPSLAALARAKLAAGRLDHVAATEALASFFRSGDARTRTLAWAFSIGAADAFAKGDYGSAARNATRWVELLRKSDPDVEIDDAVQLRDLAMLLAATGRQRVAWPLGGTTNVERDKAGLVRSSVEVEGIPLAAVLDTGANLSVVSASLAARLKLKPLAGSSAIGSGSRDAVPVRVAIAARMTIAGVHLRNVAFLILDDEQLKLPVPGYTIDLIVGFPVFQALRRVTISGNRMTVGDASERTGMGAPMRAVGNNLFVAVSINGIPTSLQLDTGASNSSLSALFSRKNPGLAASPTRTVNSAGAGGATRRQASALPNVDVRIADRSTVLSTLDMEMTGSSDVKTDTFGLIGQDIVRSFRSYTVDFNAMTFAVR